MWYPSLPSQRPGSDLLLDVTGVTASIMTDIPNEFLFAKAEMGKFSTKLSNCFVKKSQIKYKLEHHGLKVSKPVLVNPSIAPKKLFFTSFR